MTLISSNTSKHHDQERGIRRWSLFFVAALFFQTIAVANMHMALAQGDELDSAPETFNQQTIIQQAESFFGETSEIVVRALDHAFVEFGEPNAYIAGEEISGAIGAGVRFGKGYLKRQSEEPDEKGQKVYWKGPSVGYDFGANVSKVFFLVYRLEDTESIFNRFSGLQGNIYYAGGVSIDVQAHDNVTLVAMRTGVGLRAGANINYVRFTEKSSWLPF